MALTAGVAARYVTGLEDGSRTPHGPFTAVGALHLAAFAVLLLRLAAARFLVAAILSGWAVALALELPDANAGELPIAIVVLARCSRPRPTCCARGGSVPR